MKSIIVTYPDFRTLPVGLKKLLLESESFFFEEAKSPTSLLFEAHPDRREELPSQEVPVWHPTFAWTEAESFGEMENDDALCVLALH